VLRKNNTGKIDSNKQNLCNEGAEEKTIVKAKQSSKHIHLAIPAFRSKMATIQFKHPFIIRIISTFQNEKKIYLIL